jgi:hypothetical protein
MGRKNLPEIKAVHVADFIRLLLHYVSYSSKDLFKLSLICSREVICDRKENTDYQ